MMSYTVLLCDDALFMRTMLRSIVTSGDYEVIGEAGNGRAAVEMYTSLRSAMGQQQLVSEADTAGAMGFITKPFTASRVLEALADLVNRQPT